MTHTPKRSKPLSDADSPSDGTSQTQRELEISRDLWEAELDEQDVLEFIAAGGFSDLVPLCAEVLEGRRKK